MTLKSTSTKSPFADRDAEIARLRQQIAEMHADKDLRRWFDEHFYPMLGAYLGSTHRSKWPPILQHVLKEARRYAPVCYDEFCARNDHNEH